MEISPRMRTRLLAVGAAAVLVLGGAYLLRRRAGSANGSTSLVTPITPGLPDAGAPSSTSSTPGSTQNPVTGPDAFPPSSFPPFTDFTPPSTPGGGGGGGLGAPGVPDLTAPASALPVGFGYGTPINNPTSASQRAHRGLTPAAPARPLTPVGHVLARVATTAGNHLSVLAKPRATPAPTPPPGPPTWTIITSTPPARSAAQVAATRARAIPAPTHGAPSSTAVTPRMTPPRPVSRPVTPVRTAAQVAITRARAALN